MLFYHIKIDPHTIHAMNANMIPDTYDTYINPKPGRSVTADALMPVPSHAIFRNEEWHSWGGSALPHEGRWYRIFARWPKSRSFDAWITHSEIACAVGDSPLGPWEASRTLLGREETSAWDAHNFHNPLPLYAEGKFWIFYTGNYGDGTFWDHRNHQRIGVAWATHPFGPWHRLDRPIVDTSAGQWDHLLTGCPIVAQGPDGLYRMIYKGVAEGELPRGGAVRIGSALAKNLAGPWKKQEGTFFCKEGVHFTTDDNFFWYENGCYHAIVKDYGSHYQNKAKEALVLFTSPDAKSWDLAAGDPVLTVFELEFESGRKGPFHRLDQPQLVRDEQGKAVALCLSIKENPDEISTDVSYTVMVPLKGKW